MKNNDVLCHCNVKENAELIAKILDADICGEIYKESGLTPDEIKAYINAYEDYRELKEQGRLVVLPCQVGSRVWFVDNGKVDSGIVKCFDTGDPLNPAWTATVQEAPRGPKFLPLDALKLSREAAEADLKKEA